jgi:tRNA-specific 2-thiouridylase
VQCNRALKFGELLRFARALGAERVATGHYARCGTAGDDVALRRARDRAKDQSYVLARVERGALAHALFPVWEIEKDEVRERARRAGLPVHAKAESQELCFVPTGDYRDLLRARRPDLFEPGPVRDRAGVEVGRHDGVAGFTVGQRKGLGVAFGAPRYVVRTDVASRSVVVGTREELLQRRCRLRSVAWLARDGTGAEPLALQVRAHHRPVPIEAMATIDEGGEGVELALAPPGEAVTPGQLGVVYAGDRVVASGILATV